MKQSGSTGKYNVFVTEKEWDEKMKDCGWIGQSICCFSETDDLSGAVYVL